MSNDHTHFGFKSIPITEKTTHVASVFHSVAKRYDLMNDLMSFGLHRLWKRIAIAKASVKEGQFVLDLAAGTGDLSYLLAKQVGPIGCVISSDINASMLNQGRSRLIEKGMLKNLEFSQLDAESLPFVNDTFHCITIGFGLRNVTQPNLALKEMFRVLKPGGRLIILEFSHPASKTLSRLYDAYSFTMLPLLGKIVCNDETSYQYLAESIRMHPNQDTLKSMLETAGFEKVAYQNLHDGIVAIHMGFKF